MRCKNCGWENADENLKCEKCGSSLVGINDSVSVKYQSTEGFDVRKTVAGCPNCGYPLRPSDQKCPNCNSPVGGPTAGAEANISSPMGGTIIAGIRSSEKPQEGKKLVGFLVSYSLNPLGDFFPVFEGRNYIGRDNSSTICIQGDSLISSNHFSILYRTIDKKFKWKDEHSSNGTFINEKLSDEGELKNFDTIRIGSTKLLFIVIPAF
ncbi:MAG: FHA domain-containing protein [Candidatus Azobacteroides sp.]|nr:FHA domain-containing protein [Candidatus Azobacteroides sp.]